MVVAVTRLSAIVSRSVTVAGGGEEQAANPSDRLSHTSRPLAASHTMRNGPEPTLIRARAPSQPSDELLIAGRTAQVRGMGTLVRVAAGGLHTPHWSEGPATLDAATADRIPATTHAQWVKGA